jgi:hypothetical protein
MTRDQSCARNLGVLSIFGGVLALLTFGSLLLTLFLIGPMYAISNLQYMSSLKAIMWILALCISIALLGYGIFLLINYFRYPKIFFRIPKRAFWLTSALYCPAWIFPLLLTLDYPSSLPRPELWGEYLPFLWIALFILFFPAIHFTLSIYTYFSIQEAEQGHPLNAAARRE